MQPDPEGRLSEGVVVEAQIRGRLFGAPILRLDAEVVLTPARPAPVVVVAPPPAASVRGLPAPELGSPLAQAQSLVDQNAARLRALSAQR